MVQLCSSLNSVKYQVRGVHVYDMRKKEKERKNKRKKKNTNEEEEKGEIDSRDQSLSRMK